ncbi:MAG: sigma-70 family RNA polymerase sigma factor [bacterium]
MKKECIGEEKLIDYLKERLSDKERAEVKDHLSHCNKCVDALIMTKRIISDEHLPDAVQTPFVSFSENITKRVIEKVKALDDKTIYCDCKRAYHCILKKICQYLELLLDWLGINNAFLATVRGPKTITEDYTTVKKSFKDLRAEIEFEKRGLNRFLIRVMLFKENLSTQPVRVTLIHNHREVSSFLVSEKTALFEDISCGSYVLIFTQGSKRIEEYPFRINFTDQEIRDGCLLGNTQLQAEFINQFTYNVKQAIRNVLPKKQMSYYDDLHNTVFERVIENEWKKLRQYNGSSKLSTWINKIAKNIVIDHIRHEGRDAMGCTSEIIPSELIDSLQGKAEDPLSLVEKKENYYLIVKAVQEMPSNYRLILEDRFFEGLTYNKIAEKMGISLSNAYTMTSRAMKKLKFLINIMID